MQHNPRFVSSVKLRAQEKEVDEVRRKRVLEYERDKKRAVHKKLRSEQEGEVRFACFCVAYKSFPLRGEAFCCAVATFR